MTTRRYPNADPNLMIELTRDQLGVQLEFVDAIDAKLGVFLGVASALIAILMGAVTVQTQPLGYWGTRGLVVSVLAYLAVAAACIVGLWLRPWRGEIKAQRVYRDHYIRDEHVIGWDLVGTYASH
jgi:hypothetical protein